MRRETTWLVALALVATAMPARASSPPSVQWTRTFGSSCDTLVYWVQQTRDKGFIAAGRVVMNPDSGFPLDIYLLKLDSMGNTQWQNHYGSGQIHDCAFAVQQTTDGGYVLAGSGAGFEKVIVLKTDSLGNQQWKYVGLPEATVYSIQQTREGGFITGGLWSRGDSLYLLKLNSSGNFQWRRSIDAEPYRHWWARVPVEQTADVGYIICAEVLVKTDSFGYVTWSRTHPGQTYVLFSVHQTQDGGYVATGIGPTVGQSANVFNMVLLKTNSSGNQTWRRVFTGGSETVGRCVISTSDGGYAVGGYLVTADVSRGWLIKTDALGSPLWTMTLDDLGSVKCCQRTNDGGYIVGDGERHIVKLAPE